MGNIPKESQADKTARLRERRIAGLERDTASQATAGDLTADLKAVYGFRGIPLQFGAAAAAATAAKKASKPGGDSYADRNLGMRPR